MFGVEFDNSLLFPILQPEISRDLPVMFVDLAITLAPVIELADSDSQPADEGGKGNIGLLMPKVNKINYRISSVMGNPGGLQTSPMLFFSAICSSISSERTSFFLLSLSSRALILAS